jgi:hypothetical protein
MHRSKRGRGLGERGHDELKLGGGNGGRGGGVFALGALPWLE